VHKSSLAAYFPHQVRTRIESATSEETRSMRVLPTLREREEF